MQAFYGKKSISPAAEIRAKTLARALVVVSDGANGWAQASASRAQAAEHRRKMFTAGNLCEWLYQLCGYMRFKINGVQWDEINEKNKESFFQAKKDYVMALYQQNDCHCYRLFSDDPEEAFSKYKCSFCMAGSSPAG